jgi:hypothetical protein
MPLRVLGKEVMRFADHENEASAGGKLDFDLILTNLPLTASRV